MSQEVFVPSNDKAHRSSLQEPDEIVINNGQEIVEVSAPSQAKKDDEEEDD